MNAGAAATNAARLRAAADAASLRIGHVAGARSTDRNEAQVIRSTPQAQHAHAVVGPETHRENRVRATTAFEQVGPSPRFLAQRIAQEMDSPAAQRPRAAEVAAVYPSLESELDIFLPGETTVFATHAQRVDHYV